MEYNEKSNTARMRTGYIFTYQRRFTNRIQIMNETLDVVNGRMIDRIWRNPLSIQIIPRDRTAMTRKKKDAINCLLTENERQGTQVNRPRQSVPSIDVPWSITRPDAEYLMPNKLSGLAFWHTEPLFSLLISYYTLFLKKHTSLEIGQI